MKIEITPEDEKLYWNNYFKVVETLISGSSKIVYTIESTKENPTKDNKLIARIQAKKFGFVTNDASVVLSYLPTTPSCANYERDNVDAYSPTEKWVTFDTIFKNSKPLSSFETKVLQETLKRTVKHEKTDPIVESVRQKLLDRSEIGIQKYATTLKENTKDNYLNHLQQEMLDGANYIEVLLQQKLDITQLCLKYPNDDGLGKEIRKIYS